MSMDPSLLRRIKTELETHGGKLPFDDFMSLALYATPGGYYRRDLPILGEFGDFTTAPQLSPLFAQCLGRYFQAVVGETPQAALLEIGPGTGALAFDLLTYLAEKDCLPSAYYLLEVSAALKAQQQERLLALQSRIHIPIQWLDSLPEHFSGLVIANEVLDAMPVKRFRLDETLEESYVMADNETFSGIWDKPTDALQKAFLETPLAQGEPPRPYGSEINLHLSPWLASVYDCMQSGVVLLIDYGFPASVYYHPSRFMGTLMCHHRHRAHADPFILVGEQDITAHVDFTAVARASVEAGFSILGYTTQAHFLLNCGLLDLASPSITSLETKNALLRLTLPSEMGELFKVIALGKQQTLSFGFEQNDKLYQL